VFVITIVEEVRAVECIDEIAATPGLDAIFIGTSDLSFSFGLRGKQDDPVMLAAIEKIVEAGRKHNKPVGRPASTPEQVEKFRAQGFSLFQLKTDIGFLSAGAQEFMSVARSSGQRTSSESCV
jgi:2-keto-3-deoxy-L-rhamnonate aldolase RhmA